MSDEIEFDAESSATTWAAFGDLMSVLLGAFVLILASVIGIQLLLHNRLDEEVKQRQEQTAKLKTLEQALAAGRVTVINGRIGISGSVLFALNSDQLQPEGRELLQSLAAPLREYLGTREEILMVSGFTDNQPVRVVHGRFADNLELSAARALTVTRTLIADGVPSQSVFAAAFGAEQPVSSNDDEAGRAKNRRVEIAPIPRPKQDGKADAAQ